MRSWGLASFLVVLAACAGGEDASEASEASEAAATSVAKSGRDCERLRTEQTCLARTGCAFDNGAARRCIYVGIIEPQPGSGDPGGGGIIEPDAPDHDGITLPIDLAPAEPDPASRDRP